jgi:hypothetical protein
MQRFNAGLQYEPEVRSLPAENRYRSSAVGGVKVKVKMSNTKGTAKHGAERTEFRPDALGAMLPRSLSTSQSQ